LARKLAVKDAKKTGRSVSELHVEYFTDVMNAHNARYQGELELAGAIEGSSNFKAVRAATKALEAKSNEFFKDLFSEEDIPYELIREFALGHAFQRRIPTNEDINPLALVPKGINIIGQAKSKMGPEFSLSQNALGLAANLSFPFPKTPYNIVMEGLSYTPIALIPFFRPKAIRTKLREGQKVRVVQEEEGWLSKVAVGSAFMLGVASLFATSNKDGLPFITGTPKDLDERRRWEQAGIPERSVLIDGVYVPYGRLEPIGTFLGLYADTAEAILRKRDWDDPEGTPAIDMVDEMVAGLLNATLNKTVLESGIKFLDNFRYSNKGLVEGAIASGVDVGKGFIPTGVSDLARILDEEERIATTAYEKIIQRVPILRETLPADTPQFGEKEAGLNQNLFEIITKMNFVPTNMSEVQREIYRKEASIPVIDSEFIGVKLNGAELSLLRELAAPYQKGNLAVLVQSGTYRLAGVEYGAARQKVMLENYAAQSVHPGRNKELNAKFLSEGTKRFGAQWMKSLEARKYNSKIKEKGLQDHLDYMDTTYEK
jgi:hypothetical protein